MNGNFSEETLRAMVGLVAGVLGLVVVYKILTGDRSPTTNAQGLAVTGDREAVIAVNGGAVFETSGIGSAGNLLPAVVRRQRNVPLEDFGRLTDDIVEFWDGFNPLAKALRTAAAKASPVRIEDRPAPYGVDAG